MTELVTCSYAAWRPSLGQPVVASLGLPRDRPEAAGWPRCWVITPRWTYWKAADWQDQYLNQLDRFGARKIARALHQIGRETGAQRLAVLCFESVPELCHRGLLAEWWLRATGERINEITEEEQ